MGRPKTGTQVIWNGGGILPNLCPLYSQRPHSPSFFWSGRKSQGHLLLSCYCGPSHFCRGMVSRRCCSPKSQAAPPPPLLTLPLPQQRGHSPLLPFPWHGAKLEFRTQTWGPGGHQAGIVVSTARRGDPSPPVRPRHPSPLPRGRRRREPPGPGGRPGKWPMGPGGLSPAGASGSLRSGVRT